MIFIQSRKRYENKNKKGFTLIELLVVVAIIGILAGILIPGLMKKTVNAKVNKARQNAQVVFDTAQQWLQKEIIDNEKDYPAGRYINSDGSDVATGVQNDLEKSTGFKGTWAIEISSDGVDYALWTGDSSANLSAQDQLTLQDMTDNKGKIGCWVSKD